MKTAFTAEAQSRRERLRSLSSVTLRLCGVLFAFGSCTTPPPGEFEETPDEPRPREAQSDFLDIGKQAGIEWLSFVPNDQREYPELFEGLDRDQKRHVRLAPLEKPDERILIEFGVPQASKLWPVNWYGTELMAIDLPARAGFSVAISTSGDEHLYKFPLELARTRQKMGFKKVRYDPSLPPTTLVYGSDDIRMCDLRTSGPPAEPYRVACYGVRRLKSITRTIFVYAEVIADPEVRSQSLSEHYVDAMYGLLAGISIRRDLALEGFPKHKCSSSVEDLQAGKLVFPGGTLSLPLKTGQVARKTGGDSTIQVDGEGAKPWLILRRLKESGAEGDIRTRVRLDTTFARRVEKPSGRFSAGQRLANGAVAWEYADSGAEQQLVGVIATGSELLAFEVVSQGLTDGEARRNAREAARALIGEAAADPVKGEPLKVLEGWNVGTMGRD